MTASVEVTPTGRMLEAAGIGVRHHLGDRGEVDLERIDVQVGQPHLVRQPLGQRFQIQQFLGIARILPLLVGESHQRMNVAAAEIAT